MQDRPYPTPKVGRSIVRAAASMACAAAVFGSAATAAAAPQVALLVEAPPSPVQPGDTLVYRIHVSNLDKITPTGALKVSADIPQNMHVTDEPWGSCAPSACYKPYVARYGNTVNWDTTLAAGQSTSWSLTLHVDNTADHPPPADGAKVALDVVVKAGATKAAGSNALVVTEYATPAFDLAVSGATRAAPGEEVEYTFRYGNQTSAAVKGVLSFPIPAGARVVSASSGAEQKGNAIEWNVGSVAAGYSDFRAVRMRMDPKASAGSLVLLQPELRATGRNEPTKAPLAVQVGPASPLDVNVSVAPDPVSAGGTVLYKLELTNRSPDAPTGKFNVSANIPMNGFVTALQGAACKPSACYSPYKARHGSHVVWEVPSLAPGATAPLQFAFVVDKPADAAPPPLGSVLTTHVNTSLGVSKRVTLALGSAKTVGKGTPMAPLGASPTATPSAAPPPVPPPVAASAPVPVATTPEAEPEPAVEEIPEAEIAAELPPADDDAQLPAVEVKERTRWKAIDWDKHCEKRWKSRNWDRNCAKRWWRRGDWAQYCKAEGRKHIGWKKFCARDFRSWKFASSKRKDHRGNGRHDRDRNQKGRAAR